MAKDKIKDFYFNKIEPLERRSSIFEGLFGKRYLI